MLRRYAVQNSKCRCWCRLRGSASFISPLNWTELGLKNAISVCRRFGRMTGYSSGIGLGKSCRPPTRNPVCLSRASPEMRYGTPPQGRRCNLRGSLRIPKAIRCVDIDMDHSHDMEAHGPFDARYLAFLDTITQLRRRLHRSCSRLTGSVLDGADVVQDALFEAYRKLDQYDDSRPLGPGLFRSADQR